MEIKKEASAPRTFEEYIAIVKRDVPEFAEIWSELWDEKFSLDAQADLVYGSMRKFLLE